MSESQTRHVIFVVRYSIADAGTVGDIGMYALTESILPRPASNDLAISKLEISGA